jgi:hypothetical protein
LKPSRADPALAGSVVPSDATLQREPGETLLETIRSALNEQVLPDIAASTKVEAAWLDRSASLLGLAALAQSPPQQYFPK